MSQMEAEWGLLSGNALKPELLISRVKPLRRYLNLVCCAVFFPPRWAFLFLFFPLFVRCLWIPLGWVRQMCVCMCVCVCVRHSLPVFKPFRCLSSLERSWIFLVICGGPDLTQSPTASTRSNWSCFCDSWPPPGILQQLAAYRNWNINRPVYII